MAPTVGCMEWGGKGKVGLLLGRFLAMRREGGEDWTADTEKRGEGTAADILLPALIVPKEISRSRRRRSIKWPLRAIQEKRGKGGKNHEASPEGKNSLIFCAVLPLGRLSKDIGTDPLQETIPPRLFLLHQISPFRLVVATNFCKTVIK